MYGRKKKKEKKDETKREGGHLSSLHFTLPAEQRLVTVRTEEAVEGREHAHANANHHHVNNLLLLLLRLKPSIRFFQVPTTLP